VKRPWLFVELAARFPEVEFDFVGRPHFEGEGAWSPEGLPRNVRMLGHLDGPSKTEVLRSAAALVNTSIHESLSVSFLESLACETPVISCQDPEGVVSRFGSYVGRFDGDGRDALPRFAESLARLLRDRNERARLGREGRAWVAATHNPARFLEAFRELRATAGLARP
jgi:glycosyltransferase involved in cell wall biosynthesis